MRTLLPGLLTVILAGCATTSRQQLEDLVGQPASAATTSFRKAPTNETSFPDGARVMTWRWGLVSYGSGMMPPCDEVVTVWVDKSGYITQVSRDVERK